MGPAGLNLRRFAGVTLSAVEGGSPQPKSRAFFVRDPLRRFFRQRICLWRLVPRVMRPKIADMNRFTGTVNGLIGYWSMTLPQLLLQTAVTFVAASLGAIVGALLTRRTERFKHLQELRSAAYADFVRGVAAAAEQSKVRNPTGGGIALVADARARIAIYGGKGVVHCLSEFIALGAQTCSPQGMHAFAELCTSMRAETGREHLPAEEIARLLFS